MALETEIATFEARLPDLLAIHEGKWVAILGAEVLAPFETWEDALTAGYERFGPVSWLVRQVLREQPVHFFSRDLPIVTREIEPMDPGRHRIALAVLRADIASAVAEQAEARAQLDATRTRLVHLRATAAALAGMLGEPADDAPPPDRPVRYADAIEVAMRRLGRPMRVVEIAAALAWDGFPMPPDRRNRDSAIVAAMTRRPKTFARVGRGVWTLAGKGG
jgi:hypothetical protein